MGGGRKEGRYATDSGVVAVDVEAGKVFAAAANVGTGVRFFAQGAVGGDFGVVTVCELGVVEVAPEELEEAHGGGAAAGR
jgi:hypothetical protein